MEREGNEKLTRLAEFANAGGFLVCPLTTELRDALEAMSQSAARDAYLQRPRQGRGLDLEIVSWRWEGLRGATESKADSAPTRWR
jgi:ethanolamine ammonia-lyase small subunit